MNYITKVVDLIRANEFYGATENIEIAKGKYQLANNWETFISKIKRSFYGNRKRN